MRVLLDPTLTFHDSPISAAGGQLQPFLTRSSQLLAARGREFELQLLLSQNEALTYIGHLADTLSRSEPDLERLAFVRELWKQLACAVQAIGELGPKETSIPPNSTGATPSGDGSLLRSLRQR